MAGSVPRAAAGLAVLTVIVGAVLVTGRVWAGLAPAAGLLAAGVLLVRAVQRFGGVTGDVLGGCVETAVTVCLVALALLPA